MVCISSNCLHLCSFYVKMEMDEYYMQSFVTHNTISKEVQLKVVEFFQFLHGYSLVPQRGNLLHVTSTEVTFSFINWSLYIRSSKCIILQITVEDFYNKSHIDKYVKISRCRWWGWTVKGCRSYVRYEKVRLTPKLHHILHFIGGKWKVITKDFKIYFSLYYHESIYLNIVIVNTGRMILKLVLCSVLRQKRMAFP